MVSSSFFSRFKALVIKQKRVVIICICVILFVELLDDVLEGDLMTLDRLARAFFVENLRSDWLTPFMESASALATPPFASCASSRYCRLRSRQASRYVLRFKSRTRGAS